MSLTEFTDIFAKTGFKGWVLCVSSRRFGGLVGRDHYAVGRRRGVDELERGICATIPEQPASRSQHQWVDEEHILVDEVMLHERLNKLAAAHYQEVLTRLRFELSHFFRHIALEQRRVAPRQRLLQRR